jgi:hypothetical protein
MDQPVVCALADSDVSVQGSVFHHSCWACQRTVMVAPSGQRLLVKMPEALILCYPCYWLSAGPDDTVELAGTMDELKSEVRTAQPNLRRNRN